MNSRRLLGDAVARKALGERLSTCKAVTRLNVGEERDAGTLAHACGDLEESFRKLLGLQAS
jgi:hypothetical protein